MYGRSPQGPSAKELAEVATRWFRANKTEVLSSRVETIFRERGGKFSGLPLTALNFSPSLSLFWELVSKGPVVCTLKVVT